MSAPLLVRPGLLYFTSGNRIAVEIVLKSYEVLEHKQKARDGDNI